MHLSRLFQRSVRMYGNRPALVRGIGASLDYQALDRRVRALAYWLRNTLALNPGDRILLVMKNCPEYAELMLASWHAGLCAVPINSRLHPNEIDYILRDSGSRACFLQGALFQGLQHITAGIPGLHLVDVTSDSYKDALTGPALDLAAGEDDDLAWLFYTSGTTGRPKGVMLTHANLVSMALNFYADVQALDDNDAIIHVAPMSHGGGLYGIPYWMRGALQIIPESGGFDEAEFHAVLGCYENVSLFVAPTIVQRLVRYTHEHNADWPTLRTLIVGGAPFYMEDIKAAVECFGPRIAQIYGQGESPMTITALTSRRIGQAVADGDAALLGSVGYAQTSMDVAILDVDGKPVAAGMPGEVVVRGPTVMLGYWNNPAATAQTLVDGALRTGDVGIIDERGLLHLKDRSKDVIISGGTNIYPREVEEALLLHEAVEEVSVIGMPDPEWGESVVAFVVCRAGKAVDEPELDQLCIQSIARFKRPKRYVFVDELPKNSTGKVLKRELQKRIMASP